MNFVILVLPYPQDLRLVEARNSSVTIRWELPVQPFLPVTEFIVCCSAFSYIASKYLIAGYIE